MSAVNSCVGLWVCSDRFREHLRDVEINDKDASKPVAPHFNFPNHSQNTWRFVAFPFI